MKIAYLGIPGTNSYTAAKDYFGDEHELVGLPKFLTIFEQVDNGSVDYGIVPIENSLAGTIGENYDLLNRFNLNVTGEYYLQFENHLLALPLSRHPDESLSSTAIGDRDPEERLKQIKKIYSHPQPLAQCSKFFEEHPEIEKIVYSDTAGGAKYVAEMKDSTLAAIANADAGKIYGLEIIKPNIADNVEHNYTRFFVIASRHPRESGDPLSQEIPDQVGNDKQADKCSLIFTLPHVPGSLIKALQILSDHQLNLTKIESRPIPGQPFEYLFYVDFKWNFSHPRESGDPVNFRHERVSQHNGIPDQVGNDITKIIEEFKTKTDILKILGIYKSGNYDY